MGVGWERGGGVDFGGGTLGFGTVCGIGLK